MTASRAPKLLIAACALAVPLVVGGFIIQERSAQNGVRLFQQVIAIVNGHEIRVSEVQMATDDIIGQLPDMPPKLRYPFVVNYLIERHLLAQYAVKEGIAETEEYKRRLALYQANETKSRLKAAHGLSDDDIEIVVITTTGDRIRDRPLSEIGGKLSRQAFFESILYPSAGIAHSYETYVLTTVDGNAATGILVSETPEAVTLKSADALVRTYKRAEIDSFVKKNISLMPADIQKTMTTQDLIDVVEYLASLRKN